MRGKINSEVQQNLQPVLWGKHHTFIPEIRYLQFRPTLKPEVHSKYTANQ